MHVITVDPDMYRPTMAELTAIATELLAIAMHNRMPLPHYVTISGPGSIGLQFPPQRDSIDAILLWASAYCAAMRSDTHETERGPEIWVGTQFELDGIVTVDAYAHIPVPETEPTASTEQDSDPALECPF